ncbi:MAG: hypothetical protein ABL921_07250 [Pirellula sp.]
MLDVFRLIPAMQVIFKNSIEFTPVSFTELTEPQYRAYERKIGQTTEKLYRVIPFEPTFLDSNDEETVLLELTIVTETERKLLLDGVACVYRASAEMDVPNPTFEQRLEYLRPRFPPAVVGDE